ncbi:MAG: SDR family oxidoreductase [Pseudomonadales bacterium]
MSKVIVITGAGVGLGRALARAFTADDHQLVLLGRTAAKVDAVAAELGDSAMAVGCDVSVPESVRTAFAAIAERHSNIDVLINNAAIFEPFKLADGSDEQIMNMVTTNLAGPMLCAKAAIPMMQRDAHIINITSESVDMPMPHFSVYRSSKAGLEQLSKALNLELEPDGIRVTNVRAGAMYEEGKSWDIDPAAGLAFHEAATAAGINLAERPISQFQSVIGLFRTLIALPADVHVDSVGLHARSAK